MTKTQRIPGAFAGTGAAHQHEGSLPVYRCNACGDEVVWCQSRRTERRYLVNVSTNYKGARFYMGHNLHPKDCAERRQAQADESTRKAQILELHRQQAAELRELKARGATDEEFLVVINRYDELFKPLNEG